MFEMMPCYQKFKLQAENVLFFSSRFCSQSGTLGSSPSACFLWMWSSIMVRRLFSPTWEHYPNTFSSLGPYCLLSLIVLASSRSWSHRRQAPTPTRNKDTATVTVQYWWFQHHFKRRSHLPSFAQMGIIETRPLNYHLDI